MSALYKTGTVAWIRIAEASEWILAYARDYTWVYLLAGTTRLGNGSISPLTAPSDIQIVHLPEHAEPEDRDDLYVEPEPLKEGDWCLAWVQVDNPRANDDGNIMVAIPRVNRFWLMANIQPDAIVRPSAGQVPPWLEVERAEAKAISAIKTALVVDGGMHDDRYTQQTAESLYRAGIRATKGGAS